MREGPLVLADVLTELALVAADPFDVAELLHLATDRATQLLVSDGAVILLSLDGDALEPAGATGAVGDIDEIMANEGVPCRMALRAATYVEFRAERARLEFPEYAPLAEAAGIRRVLSVPLRHGESVLGTLSMVRLDAKDYTDDEIRTAHRLAEVVAASLVREKTMQAALAVTAQLEHALKARVVIEQAKGMVAAHFEITVDEALDRIRRFTRSRHLRLADVAGDIVGRTMPITDLSS